MDFFDVKFLLGNQVINATIMAWFIAQVLKLFTHCFTYGKLDFKRVIGSGGMPSSHSAGVTAMSVMIFRMCGFSSPEFAISVVFSLVVMYDATGVRRATGEHATIINKMMDLYNDGESIFGDKYLKELVGHSPLQVFAGAFLGLVIGILYVL